MSVIPGTIATDQQPPMMIPLRHFLVGLSLLLLGGLAGVFVAAGAPLGLVRLAHVHLLLAGWVCVTIMGAMTQFVPVWSNAPLHSRRLASAELWFVTAGVLGFAGAFVSSRVDLLPVFGFVMLCGFWTFVYNMARTLATADGLDVTERHFALALGFFVLVTAAGFLLALDFAVQILPVGSVTHSRLLVAHATLAVFGAVLTTVLGALYQLGTMFTQTKLHGVDHQLRRVEEIGYPTGVLLLATGRLFANVAVARLGAVLVLAGLLSFSIILGRRLRETKVERTPMLSRYAVVASAMALWALITAPTWLLDPVSYAGLFGPTGTSHLLLVGVIGFVVMGSLYHIVPFIIWVHRYSDLLGFEKVPMIDDLYDSRIAPVDFWSILLGSAVVALDAPLSLPSVVVAVGGALALVGFGLFAANLTLVVKTHAPNSLVGVFVPSRIVDMEASETPETPDTTESGTTGSR
jgi:cbb3-type cytochrome oxidase subunit 1